ncbi:hypothetical protein D3C77_254840 [compost metagenome]
MRSCVGSCFAGLVRLKGVSMWQGEAGRTRCRRWDEAAAFERVSGRGQTVLAVAGFPLPRK